jgi:hypothetical protein
MTKNIRKIRDKINLRDNLKNMKNQKNQLTS